MSIPFSQHQIQRAAKLCPVAVPLEEHMAWEENKVATYIFRYTVDLGWMLRYEGKNPKCYVISVHQDEDSAWVTCRIVADFLVESRQSPPKLYRSRLFSSSYQAGLTAYYILYGEGE